MGASFSRRVFSGDIADPPTGIVAITPSDTVDLTKFIRGFAVKTAGDVEVIMVDGTTGIYPACAPGAIYGGLITRIKNALTTATGIVGFF